jgi:hypothetical protein
MPERRAGVACSSRSPVVGPCGACGQPTACGWARGQPAGLSIRPSTGERPPGVQSGSPRQRACPQIHRAVRCSAAPRRWCRCRRWRWPAPGLCVRSDLPFKARRWLRESSRSRIASAMRRVADPGMPVLHRQLAGDDGGARACTVVDHLHQVGPGGPVHGRQRPVVQQQHVGARHRRQPAREAAVAVQDAQLFGQPWHAQVQRRLPAPAGVLRQGASQPRLARTGRLRDILPANTSFAR